MDIKLVLAISILLQITAAVLALRLIRITGKSVAWNLIAIAVFLMAIRRLITLSEMYSGQSMPAVLTDLTAETVALFTSALMLVGIALIAPLFLSIKRSKEAVQKARDELEVRVQERTADLSKTNEELQAEIAGRKKIEQALIATKKQLEHVISSSPAVIYICEPSGNYCAKWISRNVSQQVGYTEEDFLSDPNFWINHIHPDDGEQILDRLKDITREDYFGLEYRFLHKDADYHWMHDQIRVSRDDYGMPVELIGSWYDITERKLAEEELRKYREHLEELVEQRTAELREMADELTRSNKDLKEFAYVVSHDLKEPLQVIKGFLMLFEKRYKDKLDEKANEIIRFAVDGAKRMQELIKDLLEYSQVGNRGKEFKPTDCSLILNKAISNLKVSIEESGAVVTHDTLPTVMADTSQLSSLFQNLIGNAIKFHGSEAPRIHISAKRKGDEWLFSVSDNGIGIDPKFADEIFDVFQRLHSSEEYPGTGIGLAICKKIVEHHGGRIWVESEPGEGATFYFTIPERQVKA